MEIFRSNRQVRRISSNTRSGRIEQLYSPCYAVESGQDLLSISKVMCKRCQEKAACPKKGEPRSDAFTLETGNCRYFIRRSVKPEEKGLSGSRIIVMLISGWDDDGRYDSIAEYDRGWDLRPTAADILEEIEETVSKYGWEGYEELRP